MVGMRVRGWVIFMLVKVLAKIEVLGFVSE